MYQDNICHLLRQCFTYVEFIVSLIESLPYIILVGSNVESAVFAGRRHVEQMITLVWNSIPGCLTGIGMG